MEVRPLSLSHTYSDLHCALVATTMDASVAYLAVKDPFLS